MTVVHLTLNLRDMAYLPARVDGVVLVWGSRLFCYQGAPREGRFGIFRGFLLVTVTVTISRRVPVIVMGSVVAVFVRGLLAQAGIQVAT